MKMDIYSPSFCAQWDIFHARAAMGTTLCQFFSASPLVATWRAHSKGIRCEQIVFRRAHAGIFLARQQRGGVSVWQDRCYFAERLHCLGKFSIFLKTCHFEKFSIFLYFQKYFLIFGKNLVQL